MKRQLRALADFWRAQFGHFVCITAIAFLAILVLSYVAGLLFPGLCTSVVDYFSEIMASSGIMDDTGAVSPLGLFGNNLRATLATMLYGFIPFLYLPALSLGVNAIVLGVMAAYYTHNGISLLVFLSGILPHGIFEIPALLLSMASGLCLCKNINTYIRKNEKGVMKPLLLNLLRVACLLLPLLAVAAVLEAYVTPLVMSLFL